MCEEEVSIESVLNYDLINLHLNGRTKDEILREMCEMLYKAKRINSVDEFIADVYLREEEGLTGIGDSIAIPHGKSDSVEKTSIVVGRTDEFVEWPSIDGKPVKIIIMLAIKSFDKTVHIKLLSKIATSLCNHKTIEKLLEAEEKQEVIDLFSTKEGDKL